MAGSIADAAWQIEAERREAEALLEALKCQLNADDDLASRAIHSHVRISSDRVTLEMRQGEEDDSDFHEFSVAINNDGILLGPWNGTSNIEHGVHFMSDDAAKYIAQFPRAVVKAFGIRV